MLCPQTSGTNIKSFFLTINNQGNRVNIKRPAAVGVSLGMANIVTKLGDFPHKSHFNPDAPLTIGKTCYNMLSTIDITIVRNAWQG